MDLTATVQSIAAAQTSDGLIPRTPGGLADPWTHVEAAMALAVGGRIDGARRAFDWLARSQRGDGAWYQYYRSDGTVVSSLLDANFCAYVATGAWHHFLVTGDRGLLVRLWPMVERAIGFTVGLQAPGGELRWARKPDGTAAAEALVTGSACTWLSLRCASAIAAELGGERPGWERAAAALREAIVNRPAAFTPKIGWAMDWYYPVLAGVLAGRQAVDRLDEGWPTFVMDGWGVRCLSDRPWVTSAETCEAVLACLAAGRAGDARQLFDWVQHLRAPDGSYYTGMVHPDGTHFPWGERSTYSSAAAVLAADALGGSGPASTLFAGAAIVHE